MEGQNGEVAFGGTAASRSTLDAEGSQQSNDSHCGDIKCSKEYLKSCNEVLGVPDDDDLDGKVSYDDGVMAGAGAGENSCDEDDEAFNFSTPTRNSPVDQASPSTVDSCDLDRHSPLQGSPCMDCSDAGSEDDRGSGSYIDASHSIRRAVAAGITSTWVSSGGECFGSLEYSDDLASHHGLGYHGGIAHHPNSPTASPHLTSVATGGATPSFHGPLVLPGSAHQSKTHADVDDDLNLGGDNGLFGVSAACDLGDFSDVGGTRGVPDSSSGEAGPKGEEFVGPVYGPALPWQPFTAALENTGTADCGDVKGDSSCVAGECGLQNLGNTCFMAAGLQCLVNTPPFAEYFFSEPHSEEAGTLVGTFSELVHKMWSARYVSIRPIAFKQAFGNHWRDFRDYRQHDCQEFVTLLLEGLRKQMSLKMPKKINNDNDFYKTPSAAANTTFGSNGCDAYSKCSSFTAANASTVAADSLDPASSSSSPDDEPDRLFGPTWSERGGRDGSSDGDEDYEDYSNRVGEGGINRNMFLKNVPGSTASRRGRQDGELSLSSCSSSSSSARVSMRRGGSGDVLSSSTGREASNNDALTKQGIDLKSAHYDDQHQTTSGFMMANGEGSVRGRGDCSDVDLPPNLDTRDSSRMEVDEGAGDDDLATLLLPSVSSSLPSSPPSPRAVIKADEQSRGSGESQEEGCEDSGATSPKSSVSSSSVDSHLVNMRLQPIPEEVLLHAASSSLRHHKDRQADSAGASSSSSSSSSSHSTFKDKQRSRSLHPTRLKDSSGPSKEASAAVTSHAPNLDDSYGRLEDEDNEEDARMLDEDHDADDEDFLYSDADAGERRRRICGPAGDYEDAGDSCGGAGESFADSTNLAVADESAFHCDSNTNLNGVVVGKRKNSGGGGGATATITASTSSRSGNNVISSGGSNSHSNNPVLVSSSSDSLDDPIDSSSNSASARTNNDIARGTSKGSGHHSLSLPDVLQNTIMGNASQTGSSNKASEVDTVGASNSSAGPCDVSSSMDDYCAFPSSMRNQTAPTASSSTSSSMAVGGVNLLDIMKETKTSNVNVLVTENPQNNELLYDSEKYAKGDKVKLKDTLDNLNREGMGTVGSNGSLKRVKESNIYKNKNKCSTLSALEDYPNGKTKRNSKLFVAGDSSVEGGNVNAFEMEEERDQSEQVVNKRIRLDEKNMQHELERSQQQQQQEHSTARGTAGTATACDGSSPRANECVSNIARLSSSSEGSAGDAMTEASASKADGVLCRRTESSEKKVANTVAGSGVDNRTRAEKNAERDVLLAQESWNSFVGDGEGALLMDTLYGQFKSCLVCGVCGHSSVKFDPFGTLSVPLPHANETQVVVTYISSDSTPALKCLVTLCKISDVKDLKTALVQLLTLDYQRQLASHSPLGSKSAKTCGSASPKTPASLEDRNLSALSTEASKTFNASSLFGDEKAGSSDDVSLGKPSSNLDIANMSTDSGVGVDDSKFESRMDTDEVHQDASYVDFWTTSSSGSSPTNKREPLTKNTNVTEEEKISNVISGSKNSVLKGKRKRSVLRKPPDVEHIVIAEVLDNHVAKILEDSYLTKYVNQVNRSVYAFHLPPTPLPAKSPPASAKPTASVSPMPDVVPTVDKMGSRNRSNLTLFEGVYNLENPPSTTGPPSSSTTTLCETNPTEGDEASTLLDTSKRCLKGGSKICGTTRFGEYASAAAAVAAGSGGSFHGGGIDGGNASCSYPSSNSVVKPLTLEQITALSGGGGGSTSTGGGGVNGGAAGGSTPNMSASTSGISSLGLPSRSSYPSMDPTVEGMPSSSDGRRGGISAIGNAAPYDVPRRPEAYDDAEASGNGSSGAGGDQSEWKTCNICLEEMCQTELKSHGLCYDCLLCENCLDMSCKHHGGDTLPCPVCQVTLTRASLIPVAKRQTRKPKPRLLRVCVVFRLDADSRDNNKRHSSLLGHPRLVSLPSRLPLTALHDALRHTLPPNAPYTLLLVDGRGYNCSRCLFMSHCRGCEVSNVNNKNASSSSAGGGATGAGEVVVNLQAGDTVCVRFTRLTAVQRNFLTQTREHESLALRRQDKPLTLYDCLRAFTRSETLECGESWFCPECECKQSATKTVSVWRCPPFLIIHLERFLFHGTSSSKVDDKVIFPLENLDMSDYLGGRKLGPQQYNLYGVVCHMGVAQAGHYTALARSPVTGCWRYYNDESVTMRKPSEDEYSSAYLLFYHRNNVPFNMSLPRQFAFVPNACDQDASVSKPELPSSGAVVREKLPSPVVDVTDDDDVMEYDKTAGAEADSLANGGEPASSAGVSERARNGDGFGEGAVTQSSSSSPSKMTAARKAKEHIQKKSENLPSSNSEVGSNGVASTSHSGSHCDGTLADESVASTVPGSEVPMEGTILDDWMEASIPTESSSMARSSAISTKYSPSSYNKSPTNSSPSKSPRGCATKSYSNAKQQQDGSSSRESGSSLELFTISSSDTSMDSYNNTSGNEGSLEQESAPVLSSLRDSAEAADADTSSSAGTASCSTSTHRSPVAAFLQEQQKLGEAHSTSDNIDDGCGVSSSSGGGATSSRGASMHRSYNNNN